MAQKSKETRVGMKDGNGFSQQSLYIRQVPVDNVGIVGWIYGTMIEPISILHPYPCFLTFLSNGRLYI